jgi:histidine triad (HIT) family protein
MDCIFCRIVKGELPSYKVYEDEKFLGFLDISPISAGHTLLIPKKHIEWVNDYEPFCSYWETARKLSRTIQKALNPTVVSYMVYGLGVPHAHIHLIPKYRNDNQIAGPNPEKLTKFTSEKMAEIAAKIRQNVVK